MRRVEWLRDRLMVPAAIVAISLHQGTNGDISEVAWMAREGADLLNGTPLVHPDRWSWDPQPWDFAPTSPAWQYLSVWVWQTFGNLGPHLLAFLTAAACLAMTARLAKALGSRPTTTVLALAFVFLISGGVLTARAGLPAFALLLIALTAIAQLVQQPIAASPLRLLGAVLCLDFVVSYVGIWLHQSWATFAPALATLQLLPLWHSVRPRPTLRWFFPLGLLATTAGVLAGPIGWQVWPQTLEVSEACRGLVKEWKTPWQNGPVWVAIWLVCLVLLLLIVRRLRRVSVSPLALTLLLLAAGLLIAGGLAVRFILLGAYAMAPLLASMMSRHSGGVRLARLRARLGERLTEPYWRNVVALLMIPLVPLALLQAARSDFTPDTAFAGLPAGCRLFATDSTAKFVELYRPDVSIWVDGRQHYWGRQRLIRAQEYLNGDPALVPAGTTCVMLEKKQAPKLRTGLAASSSWQRIVHTKRYDIWALTRQAP